LLIQGWARHGFYSAGTVAVIFGNIPANTGTGISVSKGCQQFSNFVVAIVIVFYASVPPDTDGFNDFTFESTWGCIRYFVLTVLRFLTELLPTNENLDRAHIMRT
jgi:hypothetical protein